MAKDGNRWPVPEFLPRTLYRYVSCTRAEQILAETTLYFSSPGMFNDPFDCRLRPSFDVPKKDLLAIARQLAQGQFPSASRQQQRDLLRKAQPRIRTDFFEKAYSNWERMVLDNSGILCLSEKRDDILMWSHYAGGHSGVCLEFKYDPGEKFLGYALPVHYADEFPEVSVKQIFDGQQDHVTFAKMAFLTKSAHWSYEKEWRLIDLVPGVRKYRFPAELLTGLILGNRMTGEQTHKIRKLAAQWSRPPTMYQAHRKDRQFALDIRSLRNANPS
jgi:hypothetical protein